MHADGELNLRAAPGFGDCRRETLMIAEAETEGTFTGSVAGWRIPLGQSAVGQLAPLARRTCERA